MAVQKEKVLENGIVPPKKMEEPKYTIDELAAASGRFGVRPECVVAALHFNQVQAATLNEAKRIVEDFMGRKVK